jgi:hypothetical protein
MIDRCGCGRLRPPERTGRLLLFNNVSNCCRILSMLMSLKKFILSLMIVMPPGCGGSHGFPDKAKCVGMIMSIGLLYRDCGVGYLT